MNFSCKLPALRKS